MNKTWVSILIGTLLLVLIFLLYTVIMTVQHSIESSKRQNRKELYRYEIIFQNGDIDTITLKQLK